MACPEERATPSASMPTLLSLGTMPLVTALVVTSACAGKLPTVGSVGGAYPGPSAVGAAADESALGQCLAAGRAVAYLAQLVGQFLPEQTVGVTGVGEDVAERDAGGGHAGQDRGDIGRAGGRARLSYRQAEALFKTAMPHQLRHSALTHDAEEGVSTPMLIAKSRHIPVASLAWCARPSAEALGRWQVSRDLSRR
jgi:hypothetical protein